MHPGETFATLHRVTKHAKRKIQKTGKFCVIREGPLWGKERRCDVVSSNKKGAAMRIKTKTPKKFQQRREGATTLTGREGGLFPPKLLSEGVSGSVKHLGGAPWDRRDKYRKGGRRGRASWERERENFVLEKG